MDFRSLASESEAMEHYWYLVPVHRRPTDWGISACQTYHSKPTITFRVIVLPEDPITQSVFVHILDRTEVISSCGSELPQGSVIPIASALTRQISTLLSSSIVLNKVTCWQHG